MPKGTKQTYDKARIERAARLYRTNRDAGQALGVHPSSFVRMCNRFGITPPHRRNQ